MTSPRDLRTEADLDRVNPHQKAHAARPGCSTTHSSPRARSSPSPLRHPTLHPAPSRPPALPLTKQHKRVILRECRVAQRCCCCCCGCGHPCCIDRSQASTRLHPSLSQGRWRGRARGERERERLPSHSSSLPYPFSNLVFVTLAPRSSANDGHYPIYRVRNSQSYAEKSARCSIYSPYTVR